MAAQSEAADAGSGEVPDVVVSPCAPINVERPILTATGPAEDVDPVDRPDLVAQEFRRVEIPRPTLVMAGEIEDEQVPGKMWGAALRGTHLNMWADAADHTLGTTLLGVEVTIRATPLNYTWDYGDGQAKTSAYAGGPVTAGAAARAADSGTATSHQYEATGFYPVSVTTTYAGQFKTPTSDWIPIPGVATVTSPAKTATIWKSETRLVSGDCTENPKSWGCERVPFPWEGGPQTSEEYKAAREQLDAQQRNAR
ncbi:hypothetical protein EV380_2299 [Zhihengliuella halotolerans]|uniref:PKD domain-containing protein n=2 Tax=Zhihengliuella halotolerans TaxID=370736 RepID=A0A4Q8AEI6_9MICC|nr:hypothetical protein EV380_2299 [Zhihengliuella halotolerans]